MESSPSGHMAQDFISGSRSLRCWRDLCSLGESLPPAAPRSPGGSFGPASRSFPFRCRAIVREVIPTRKAQDRSSALSRSTRVRLRTVCRSVVAVSIAAIAIATLLRLAGGQYERDFATDLQILSAVLLFAGYCVADVCGERFSAVFRTTEP